MVIREFLSGLKKKFKNRGSKHKPDRTGADSGAESVDSAGSLSRPVPHVVAGSSHNRGDDGTNADGWRVRSARTLIPGVPGLVPAPGSDNNQEGIGEGEADQRYRLGQEKNGVDEGKVGQVCPSQSAPIIHSPKPDGTQMRLFQLPPLIIPFRQRRHIYRSQLPTRSSSPQQEC